ncbi:MAG: hypothetical protein Q9170_004872 [Blastenia crenularia]
MLLTTFTALALGVASAQAFTNTSPLFLFSTSELLTTSPQITTAETIFKSISFQLSTCPSDTYIIVTQPGVHAEDYKDRYAAPYLRKKIQGEDKRIRSSMSITDILGEVDTDALMRLVGEQCGAAVMKVDASTGSFTIADDPKPRVIKVDFPAPPTGSKTASKLHENDAFLSSLLDFLPTSNYTVLYTTTPSPHKPSSGIPNPEPAAYEMDTSFSSQAHMELKRDTGAHGKRADGGNGTELVDGPLFEKYAFLSPGIFMALLVIIPLFLILYVGVSGVGSLQVSYAAFDKEMGPAAQKKQQ